MVNGALAGSNNGGCGCCWLCCDAKEKGIKGKWGDSAEKQNNL